MRYTFSFRAKGAPEPAYKIMEKSKINKESENVETAQDKGVDSTDLLKSDICLTCKLKQFSDLLSDIVITELNRRGRESLDEIGKFLTEKDHSDH